MRIPGKDGYLALLTGQSRFLNISQFVSDEPFVALSFCAPSMLKTLWIIELF